MDLKKMEHLTNELARMPGGLERVKQMREFYRAVFDALVQHRAATVADLPAPVHEDLMLRLNLLLPDGQFEKLFGPANWPGARTGHHRAVRLPHCSRGHSSSTIVNPAC